MGRCERITQKVQNAVGCGGRETPFSVRRVIPEKPKNSVDLVGTATQWGQPTEAAQQAALQLYHPLLQAIIPWLVAFQKNRNKL